MNLASETWLAAVKARAAKVEWKKRLGQAGVVALVVGGNAGVGGYMVDNYHKVLNLHERLSTSESRVKLLEAYQDKDSYDICRAVLTTMDLETLPEVEHEINDAFCKEYARQRISTRPK